jgi:hypothetical protein
MELKSKLTLATLICAGLFATGCSQQQSAGAQQTQQQTAEPAPAPAPAPRHYAPPPRHQYVPPVKVPSVKAKGNYKGAVQMDQSSQNMMQQYQH